MFEKIFRSLSPSHLLFYGLFLLLLPFLFLFMHFVAQIKKIDNASLHVEQTIGQFMQKEQKQSLNKACKKYFAKREKYALEKALEKVSLLKREKSEIEKLIHRNTFFGNRPLEERLEFLKGRENHLLFQEGNAVAKFSIQESIETLVHPVEMDTSDLKEILSLIEGNNSLFPQIIVLDFHIKKVTKATENEIFLCNMKLLKREFL